MTTRIFPVALILQGRRCLLVGSTPETTQRARELVDAGARLTVVSPSATAELVELAERGSLGLEARAFEERDLEGQWLAMLADADAELATRMGRAAADRRIFFCAVDQPDHSSFWHVAIARAGLVQIAISTSGAAPALARRLREELQRVLDASGLAAFVERLAELRRNTPSSERGRVLGEAVRELKLSGALDVPRDQPPGATPGTR